jgi:hypothetical protein
MTHLGIFTVNFPVSHARDVGYLLLFHCDKQVFQERTPPPCTIPQVTKRNKPLRTRSYVPHGGERMGSNVHNRTFSEWTREWLSCNLRSGANDHGLLVRHFIRLCSGAGYSLLLASYQARHPLWLLQNFKLRHMPDSSSSLPWSTVEVLKWWTVLVSTAAICLPFTIFLLFSPRNNVHCCAHVFPCFSEKVLPQKMVERWTFPLFSVVHYWKMAVYHLFTIFQCWTFDRIHHYEPRWRFKMLPMLPKLPFFQSFSIIHCMYASCMHHHFLGKLWKAIFR